ncbi:MAG: TfoX/Sxy family protein [Dermatophilaceae bacterium]
MPTWGETAEASARHTARMAYDEELADRLREALQDQPGVSEQKMFGGLAFLIGGNMAVAASGQGGLMLRVDPGRADDLVDDADCSRMIMRGRSMNGWLRVTDAAIADDAGLARWIEPGVSYARALPPKAARPAAVKRSGRTSR